MFLNSAFCMDKFLAREVTIFPEKIITLNFFIKNA